MKKLTFIIAMILFIFSACKKDDQTNKPINNFVNTAWESINPLALSISIDFINDTECKFTTKVPFFASITYFENYTFNEYKANLIDKNTRKTDWVCVINGGTFSLEGRSEVFTRIK